MGAMELLVVRHAQSTWNAQHRWAGQRDPGLSAQGRAAASALAARLAALHPPVAAVATSDLRRARQTAQILTHALGLPAPACVPGLRERHAGQWTERTSQHIQADFPGELDRWRRGEVVNPPGSEPWDAFTDRVLAALGHLAAAGIADRIVVVAHQGVLRALEHHFGSAPCPAADLDGVWLHAEHRALAWLARW
jgi:glucosyl-3-phosphoglycerate phosphatase